MEIKRTRGRGAILTGVDIRSKCQKNGGDSVPKTTARAHRCMVGEFRDGARAVNVICETTKSKARAVVSKE